MLQEENQPGGAHHRDRKPNSSPFLAKAGGQHSYPELARDIPHADSLGGRQRERWNGEPRGERNQLTDRAMVSDPCGLTPSAKMSRTTPSAPLAFKLSFSAFAGANWQVDGMSFNEMCQAIVVAANTPHFASRSATRYRAEHRRHRSSAPLICLGSCQGFWGTLVRSLAAMSPQPACRAAEARPRA
jgi:hypothetical protein